MPIPIGPHQGFPYALVVSLAHEDLRSASASDVTMSLSVTGQDIPPSLVYMTGTPGLAPPVAPVLSPLVRHYGPAPQLTPAVVPPQIMAPPPAVPAPMVRAPRSFEPLKLCALKDDKAFIDNNDLIQYYLCVPEFSTGRPDDALIADSSNVVASWMWEGQLRLASKDGSL